MITFLGKKTVNLLRILIHKVKGRDLPASPTVQERQSKDNLLETIGFVFWVPNAGNRHASMLYLASTGTSGSYAQTYNFQQPTNVTKQDYYKCIQCT